MRRKRGGRERGPASHGTMANAPSLTASTSTCVRSAIAASTGGWLAGRRGAELGQEEDTEEVCLKQVLNIHFVT